MTSRMLSPQPEPAIGTSADSPVPDAGPRWHWWLAIFLILIATFAVFGAPVPSANEPVYLLVIKRLANPAFMAADWTLSSGFDEHFVFNRLVAPIARLLDLSVMAWIGRVASWTALAILILKVGRRLGASYLGAAAAVALWIGLDQSIGIGAEFMIGAGFEAKALAYPLWFGALILALDRRIPWAMLLAGLTATIHPAIGLWGSGGLVAALLWERTTRKASLRWLPVMVLTALPGIVTQALSLQRAPMAPEDAEFLALERVPHHSDPLVFGRRGWLLFVAILTFNLLYGWMRRSEYKQRLLVTFQALSAVALAAGVVMRLAGQYWFPLTFPFRVLPPLATLVFGLHLAALFRQWRRQGFPRLRLPAGGLVRWVALSGIGAVLVVAVVRDPILEFVVDTQANVNVWTDTSNADYEAAMEWIASSTPLDSQVLAPPYTDDVLWLGQRGIFVSWKAIPYDRMAEWIDRLERVGVEGEEPEDWAGVYAGLSEAEVESIVNDYDIDYVVTSADYSLPEEATFGDWSVYSTAG